MRRSFVSLSRLLLVLFATLCAACSAPAQPAASTAAPTAGPPQKIGIAYSNLIADSLSLWVARESGIFAKNGLDVDLQYIASSNAFDGRSSTARIFKKQAAASQTTPLPLGEAARSAVRVP